MTLMHQYFKSWRVSFKSPLGLFSIKRRLIFIGLLGLMLSSTVWLGAIKYPDFESETMRFGIKWKGIRVGTVLFKSQSDMKAGTIRSVAVIDTGDYLKKIYHIGGIVSHRWSIGAKKPTFSYEEIYQGKKYIKRHYYFKGNKVNIKEEKKKFNQFSYPHTLKNKKSRKRNKNIINPGFQDVLGVYHHLRSNGIKPVVGQVQHVHIIPAGRPMFLILKVLKKETIKTEKWGNREVFLVKSGLSSRKKGGKISSESELFFKTKSNIYMYITADEKAVPIKIWTELPWLGEVNVNLEEYDRK